MYLQGTFIYGHNDASRLSHTYVTSTELGLEVIKGVIDLVIAQSGAIIGLRTALFRKN